MVISVYVCLLLQYSCSCFSFRRWLRFVLTKTWQVDSKATTSDLAVCFPALYLPLNLPALKRLPSTPSLMPILTYSLLLSYFLRWLSRFMLQLITAQQSLQSPASGSPVSPKPPTSTPKLESGLVPGILKFTGIMLLHFSKDLFIAHQRNVHQGIIQSRQAWGCKGWTSNLGTPST